MDPNGLADALIARLPMLHTLHMRPGFFWRAIPAGYVDTRATGENVIQDPKLARYYDKLAMIICGPIWSMERFETILLMNLGCFDHLIDRELYGQGGVPRVPEDAAPFLSDYTW